MSRRAPAGAELTWTAGAVARMLGLPPSTLRSWHRRYALPPGGPHAGRHRRYRRADIDALVRMKRLIDRGVSAESAARQAFRPTRAEAAVGDVLDALARLDTDTATAILDAHLAAHGVVATWTDLCCPALTGLGGPANPATDPAVDPVHRVDLVHALSWAVTAALHRAPAPTPAGPPVLLAAVDGDRHTLPLEALRAALAQHGVPARLLGGSVPPHALADAMDRVRPRALVLWSSGTSHPLTDPAPGGRPALVVLTGPGWDGAAHPPGARNPRTLAEAVEVLVHPPDEVPGSVGGPR